MKKKNKGIDQRTRMVIKSLSELGGCARPIDIFKNMDCSSWGTRTPLNTVRQKLQMARDKGLVVQGQDHLWYTIAYALQLQTIDSKIQHLAQKVDDISHHETIVKIKDGKVLVEQSQGSQSQSATSGSSKTIDQKAAISAQSTLTHQQLLEQWVTTQSSRVQVASLLHDYLAEKVGKDATIVICGACRAGAIAKPSYKAFSSLYPKAISRNRYYEYTDGKYEGYDKDRLHTIIDRFKALIIP